MTRTGRRPGAPGTRDAILAAARVGFATRGYEATSLRSIASEAGVDPGLVVHYFGTKDGLFAAATAFPAALPALLGSLTRLPPDEFPYALVRAYLNFVDSDSSRNAILALVRSAVSNERAAATLREFMAAELLPVIARMTGHSDAERRASLVTAQLIGIAMMRHVLRLDPLVTATPEEIAALVAPAIRQYLQ